jgi:hypothetical protein
LPDIAKQNLNLHLVQRTNRTALLPALQALLLNPEYTLPTTTICRTVIVAIVASIVDDALSSVGNSINNNSSFLPPHPPSLVATSLIKVLMVAPHTEL